MITDDGKRQHYVAVKSLSVLLRGISLSNNADFYCLNCFHSYRTLNKLKKHEITCNNDAYCSVDMPKEHKKNKIFTWKKVIKSSVHNLCGFKMPTKKCDLVKTIPKSLTEKKVKHKPSGYAWCSICSFDEKKNRRYFYRGKDY